MLVIKGSEFWSAQMYLSKSFSAMPIEEVDKLWRKHFLVKQRCMSCNKYLAADITSVYWHFVADVDDLNKGDDIT